MLVIDASAVVELLTTDPAEVPELAERIRSAEWMSAPSLIDYEVHNVLRKMVYRKDISADMANESLQTFWKLRIGRYQLTNEMSARVWELRNNISAYDAAYIVLAEKLNVPLVTTEKRLARAATEASPAAVESFTS